jgi:hypothetical protein
MSYVSCFIDFKVEKMMLLSRFLYIFLFSMFSFGAMADDFYLPTRYENVSVDKMVSVYKRAYEKNGFVLEREKKLRIERPSSPRYDVLIVFRFRNYPLKVAFTIQSLNESQCTPCYGVNGFGTEKILNSNKSTSMYNHPDYDVFHKHRRAASKEVLRNARKYLMSFDPRVVYPQEL